MIKKVKHTSSTTTVLRTVAQPQLFDLFVASKTQNDLLHQHQKKEIINMLSC